MLLTIIAASTKLLAQFGPPRGLRAKFQSIQPVTQWFRSCRQERHKHKSVICIYTFQSSNISFHPMVSTQPCIIHPNIPYLVDIHHSCNSFCCLKHCHWCFMGNKLHSTIDDYVDLPPSLSITNSTWLIPLTWIWTQVQNQHSRCSANSAPPNNINHSQHWIAILRHSHSTKPEMTGSTQAHN